MEENDVIGQLNGLAFEEIGLSSDALAQLGIVSQTRAFDRSQIYNDNFEKRRRGENGFGEEDDEDQDSDDLENEVDRELELENERMHERGLQALNAPSTSLGGANRMGDVEDDNYDDDDEEDMEGRDIFGDEEEEDADGEADGDTQAPQHQNLAVNNVSSNQFLPPYHLGTTIQVKQEESTTILEYKKQTIVTTNGQPVSQQDARKRTPTPKEEEEEKVEEEELNLAKYYPSFGSGKVLDYSELFAVRPSKRQKFDKQPFKVNLPSVKELPRANSTKESTVIKSSSIFDRILDDFNDKSVDDANKHIHGDVLYSDLYKNVRSQIDNGKQSWVIPSPNQLFAMYYDDIKVLNEDEAESKELQFTRNYEFERGEWTRNIFLSASEPAPIVLRNSAPDELEMGEQDEQKSLALLRANKQTANHDIFNLSNDKFYEIPKEAKKVVRQTFGHLEVQHSYPALKLQLPFYKTRLTKSDLRSFHRPAIQFPTNVTFKFSKIKTAKKKKDKHGKKMSDPAQALKTTSDLSLRDTSSFVLCEYSEEAPPVLNNLGMGSIIVNYYRKKNERDEYVPKLDLGEPFLLDPSDESPFMKFGNVNPGQTIPALYNNLIRAPLFRHQPAETDFLLIRNTINGETKYYLRQIRQLFAVGQTYPVVEVPGPNSRKISNYTKNRLMVIVFRLIKKSKFNRLNIKRLLKYFPDQTDLQMRQRLKDFMEYNRKGENRKWWTLKPTCNIPDKDEMLKMIEVETAVLYESMLVGVRTLEDAGYSGHDDDKGKDDEESKLPVERQLAPWNTTKNFIAASQNKAWLRLHGEGDPSGRGEAFSFLRASMKEPFLRPGETKEMRKAELEGKAKWAHKINIAEQTQIYKSEIDRIWKAQFRSLSSKIPPELTAEDEARFHGKGSTAGGLDVAETPMTEASPFTRDDTPDRDETGSIGSRGGQSNKILRINRKGHDGKWTREIVRDPAVISAYLRQRQLIEEDRFPDEALVPTNDEEKNKIIQKKIQERLDKMRKNQDRRLQRKKGEKGASGTGEIRGETTRRCGNCGQVGHMKTNRACPRWAEFNGPQAAHGQSSNTTGTPVAPGLNPFGGPLGIGGIAPPQQPQMPPQQPASMDASTPRASSPSGAPRPKLKLTFASRD